MSKLVILGDYWGETEAQYETSFVGHAGAELWRMLSEAGYPCSYLPYNFVSSYRMTQLWRSFPHTVLSVFNCRPPDPEGKDQMEFFYAKLTDGIPVDKTVPRRRIGTSYYYLREQFSSYLQALHKRLEEEKPNLIIALGATACWALGLSTSIGKIRGTIHETPYGKVIPTYHPISIIRNWSNRTVSLLDLFKARKEMGSREITRVAREIWAEPTIPDLWKWWDTYGTTSSLLAFDIETEKMQQISEVGFASDAYHALHIPFLVKEGKVYRSYWKTLEEEMKAWKFVRHVMTSQVYKIAQNGKYDSYWLVKELGFPVTNWAHDTMVKAHCWQPELTKSLQFLGSIFLNERDWKSIRHNVGKDA